MDSTSGVQSADNSLLNSQFKVLKFHISNGIEWHKMA